MGDFLDLHVREVAARDYYSTTVVLEDRLQSSTLSHRFGLELIAKTVFTLPLSVNLQEGDRIQFYLAVWSEPAYSHDDYNRGTVLRKMPGDDGEEQEIMSFNSADMRLIQAARDYAVV